MDRCSHHPLRMTSTVCCLCMHFLRHAWREDLYNDNFLSRMRSCSSSFSHGVKKLRWTFIWTVANAGDVTTISLFDKDHIAKGTKCQSMLVLHTVSSTFLNV